MQDLFVKALEEAYREPRVAGKLPAPGDSVKIFRSRDYRAIRQLATHARIFPHACDDFTANPEAWQPTESELIVYLLASDDRGPFGLGVFAPDNWACWKAHMGFLPCSYGNLALSSFKNMLEWMWRETQARRLVGEIVRDNTLAIRFARRAGFEIYGINKRSKLRGGVLVDQVCLGISKP
jgi:hypothetical protein